MLFDFSGRLRENAQLQALLAHYVQVGTPDRTAWQDRLMQLDGVEPRELTALHGELIAFDWLEQNTGHVTIRPDGTLAECYRVTASGMREFRRLTGLETAEEPPEAAEKAPPRPPRRRKEKPEPQAQATT